MLWGNRRTRGHTHHGWNGTGMALELSSHKQQSLDYDSEIGSFRSVSRPRCRQGRQGVEVVEVSEECG